MHWWLAAVVGARAQEGPGVDLAEEAEIAFEMGVEHMRRGEYLSALSFLLASNRLANNRNVLFNIAGAYEALGRNEQAYQYYTEYLGLETDPKRREEGERALDRLAGRVALVKITSEPPGATIYIDRRDLGARGVTPRTIAVPSGPHLVVVEAPGFAPAEQQVKPLRGGEQTAEFALEPLLGSVRIFGEPAGAEVRLEGSDTVLGTLPSTFQVPVGTAVLEVSAVGHEPRKIVVEVAVDATAQLDGTLEEFTGRVVVDSPGHPGALIEVDGRAVAFAPAVVEVPTGSHTLRVSAPGSNPYVELIDVAVDQPLSITARLRGVLDTTVVTAARREERASESAAILSVISREEIDDFGPLDLYERLSLVSGIETIESYFGYTQVTFRGLLQTHYNNKSLFLINGHALYNTVEGSYFLEQVPMTAIDRVEVIRGPASTLYATNAYGGVINVLTQRPTDEPETEVYLRGGSFWTRDLGFSLTRRVGDVGLYLFGQVRDSDGYDFVIDRDEDGLEHVALDVPLVVDGYENDATSIYGGLTWRGFTGNYGFFELKKDKFGLIPTLLSTGARTVRGGLVDLTQAVEVSERAQVTTTVRYDGQWKPEERSFYPPVSAAPGQPVILRWLSHKFGGDASFRAQLGDDRPLNVLAGVSADYLQSPYYTFHFTQDRNLLTDEEVVPGSVWEVASAYTEPLYQVDFGPYVNADWKPLGVLKLSGGALYNVNSNYGGLLAPRGSVILTPADELVFKLLYGRAYRAPSLFELGVRTLDVLYGGDVVSEALDVPPLQPELIDSIDADVEWRPSIYSIRLVGYVSWTENLIERSGIVPAESPLGNTEDTPAYSNNPGQQYAGVELDLELRLDRLRIHANGSYRAGWDADREPLPYWFAPVLANLDASGSLSKAWSVAGIAQLVGPRWGTMLAGTENARELSIDPYLLVHAQVAYQPLNGLELALSVKNLFDNRYEYPEYIRQNVDTVPGGPGREWFAQARVVF